MNTSRAVTVNTVMGKIASIVGYTAGVPSLFIILLGLTDLESDGAADAVILFLIILMPCIFLIYKGIQIQKRIRRFKKYDSVILTNITPIEDIAARTSQSVDFVRIDLQKMINKNFFVNAQINMDTNKIFISGRNFTASNQEQEPLQDSLTYGERETANYLGNSGSSAICIEYRVTKENYINAIKNDLNTSKLLVGVLGVLAFLALYLMFCIISIFMELDHIMGLPIVISTLMLLLYFAVDFPQIIIFFIIFLLIAGVLLEILFSRRSRAVRIVKGRLKRGEVDPQYFGCHRLELMEDGIEHRYGSICARRAYAGIQKIAEYPGGIMIYNSEPDRDIIPFIAFRDIQQRRVFLNHLQIRISQAKNGGNCIASMQLY